MQIHSLQGHAMT